jgi:hypothetical protein
MVPSTVARGCREPSVRAVSIWLPQTVLLVPLSSLAGDLADASSIRLLSGACQIEELEAGA